MPTSIKCCTTALFGILIGLGPLLAVARAQNNCNSPGNQQEGGEQELLTRMTQARKCAADATHVLWKAEVDIGVAVKAEAIVNRDSPRWKLFEYVSANKDYFKYDESQGHFLTTDKRLIEIRQLDPRNAAVPEIEYEMIRQLDRFAWEDGDGRAETPMLLERYRALIVEFPTADSSKKAQDRVNELLKLQR